MLLDFFQDYVMKLVPIMLRMQLRGIAIDLPERARIRDEKVTERAAAADRLRSLFPHRKLMGEKTVSSTELIKLLYTDMGLPVQKHPKTKKPTANAEALERLEKFVGDDLRPTFADILTVRDLGVLISTFLDCPLDIDNRMRWSTNLAGTSVGRVSTSSSPWWTGTNVQNQPQEVRRIFVADPGCAFIYADGEQAESRVVAWLAQDPMLMSIYNSGLNSHIQVAHRAFGVPLPESDEAEAAFKETILYERAKRGTHATFYGMGKRKAALVFRSTEREAEEVLRRIHNIFPCIRSVFHANVDNQVQRTRTLYSPFGRRRQFFGRMDDDLYRKARAAGPEMTVADWLDIGLLRLVRFTHGEWSAPEGHILARYLTLDPTKLRFVKTREDMLVEVEPAINVHDGLLVQAKLADLKRANLAVREALTYEIPFPAGDLVIPTDAKAGLNWGPWHPEHAACSPTCRANVWGMKKATNERIEALMNDGKALQTQL